MMKATCALITVWRSGSSAKHFSSVVLSLTTIRVFHTIALLSTITVIAFPNNSSYSAEAIDRTPEARPLLMHIGADASTWQPGAELPPEWSWPLPTASGDGEPGRSS